MARWDAALKLLGSVAIAEYAELGDEDLKLLERLKNLARPSLGRWWEFVRRLVPVLADAGDASSQGLRQTLFGRTRDDLPRAAGLDAMLRESLQGKHGARTTVRLAELFDRLLQYRNVHLGHGAAGQRSYEDYGEKGCAILLGVAEILGKLDVLAGRRMIYIADVRRQKSGAWLVERYESAGETAQRMESWEWAETGTEAPSWPWLFPLTERRWPAPATTTPSASGVLCPTIRYGTLAGLERVVTQFASAFVRIAGPSKVALAHCSASRENGGNPRKGPNRDGATPLGSLRVR
jgi:hypothetical protein